MLELFINKRFTILISLARIGKETNFHVPPIFNIIYNYNIIYYK